MTQIRITLTAVPFLLLAVSAQAVSQLPDGYCQVACADRGRVSPFDFARLAREKGDPNHGGTLGDTVLIPTEHGRAPTKRVRTRDWLSELDAVERWSAGTCGKSLNDDSWKELRLVAPCPESLAQLAHDGANIQAQHAVPGTPAPSDRESNARFVNASTAQAMRHLDTELYCRYPDADNSNAMHLSDCQPYHMALGKKTTFASFVDSESCWSVSAPAFAPESSYSTARGVLSCRKGLPDGSQALTSHSVNYGLSIFGHDLSILKITSQQSAPVRSTVTHTSNNYVMGYAVCTRRKTGNTVSYDEECPTAAVHKGVKTHFLVGPIPVTVETGAEGEARVKHFARVSPLFANGRVDPSIALNAYSAAYVDLIIARAGVEANLVLIKDIYDMYGLANVSYLSGDSRHDGGFFFSEKVTGTDELRSLDGEVNLFAAIPAPKFFGWNWKKYTYNIFESEGVSTKGFVFDDVNGPEDMTDAGLRRRQ